MKWMLAPTSVGEPGSIPFAHVICGSSLAKAENAGCRDILSLSTQELERFSPWLQDFIIIPTIVDAKN
jgi:hypothetical protein